MSSTTTETPENPLVSAQKQIKQGLINQLATKLVSLSDLAAQKKAISAQEKKLQEEVNELRFMVKGVDFFVESLVPQTKVEGTIQGDMFN